MRGSLIKKLVGLALMVRIREANDSIDEDEILGMDTQPSQHPQQRAWLRICLHCRSSFLRWPRR